MKKIILACALALGIGSVANAQTVMSSRFFDNTYVGVNVAAQTGMHGFGERVYPAADLYLGKWITPAFGLEINGEALFHNSFKSMEKPVDGVYVGMNAMFNLNNIIHKYKGQPDRVEFIPFVGLGALHGFGEDIVQGGAAADGCMPPMGNLNGAVNSNGLGAKAGLNVAFNLGKSRAWTINVRPTATWALTYGSTVAKFNSLYGRVSLEAGFTYKFKNRYGTHNFVLATLRDQAEIDALNDRINYLNEELAKKPKEVIKEKQVMVEVPVEGGSYTLSFDKGSAVVKGNVAAIAADLNKTKGDITICGNTSPEGSEKVNKALAIRRAEAAKKALVDAGVDASRIKILNNYEDKRNAIIQVVK